MAGLPRCQLSILARSLVLPASARLFKTSKSIAATAVAIPLAQTGEGISECELIQWFVKDGDTVKEFDKLCEVQSDKASVEISSRFNGIVRKTHHNKGDVVKVGAPLLDLEVDPGTVIPPDLQGHVIGRDQASVQASQDAQAATATTQQESRGSTCSVEEAVQLLRSMQDKENTSLQQVHSVTFASATSGNAAAGLGFAAAAVQPDTGISSSMVTATQAVLLQEAVPVSAAAAQAAVQYASAGDVLASPAVRHLARQLNVDLSKVAGTGPKGRVTKEDVERFAFATSQQIQSASNSTAAPLPTPTNTPSTAAAAAQVFQPIPRPAPNSSTVLPVRGYRRAMIKSMTAVAAVPHFHLHDEACVDVLLQLRKSMAQDSALGGVKLTMLPFIVKAMSLALAEQPLLNASLAPDGNAITLHGSHNVGIAMATPHGLVVPNIKQVESLSVAQIARELARLQVAASTNKLTTEDISGGTVTLSNIGSIGGMFANPLVNPPEAAILAIGRVRQVVSTPDRRSSALLGAAMMQQAHKPPGTHTSHASPLAGNASHSHHHHVDTLPVHHVMGLSWGADHRVLDGAALAAASNVMKAYLEQPERMIMRLT